MLLQAADFLHLYRIDGVELQMGGADQWGNITAGLELIRKEFGAGEAADLAFGRQLPAADQPERREVRQDRGRHERLARPDPNQPVRVLPVLARRRRPRRRASTCAGSRSSTARRIEGLEAEQAAQPGGADRPARARLRHHGARPRRRRGCGARSRPARQRSRASRSATPRCSQALYDALDALRLHGGRPGRRRRCALGVASGLYPSNGEARRTIQQGGLSINDERVAAPDATVPRADRGRGTSSALRQEEPEDRPAEGLDGRPAAP